MLVRTGMLSKGNPVSKSSLLHLCVIALRLLCLLAAEDVLPQLARAVGAASVYCHGEVTAEEVKVEAGVARALDKAGAALKVGWPAWLLLVQSAAECAPVALGGSNKVEWQQSLFVAAVACVQWITVQ